MRGAIAGRRHHVMPVFGALAVACYVFAVMLAMTATSYDVWGGLVLAPVLVAVSLPVLHRIGRRDASIGFGLLVTALLLKLVSSLVRYWQSYILYPTADGERYHDAGVAISQALHQGLPFKTEGAIPGTGFLEGLTGYVYWAIGPSRVAGFIFFSWLGFWGLLLFHRAFTIAMPTGDSRRYARLVLFLPSLLFWPSSIGKEAWMTLCLGMASYGAARLLSRRRGGILALALGLTGASYLRPHMAVLVFGGLFVGYLARPYSRRGAAGPVLKGIGVVALVIAGSLLVTKAETFFGVDTSKDGSVTQVLDSTVARTSQGGSSFEATPVRSPLDLPGATMSVLLRPFPWEARNIQSLVASAESLLLIALLWHSRRRLAALPRLLRSQPYVGYCLTYTLLFVTAFSSFGNFGILTRQRVQVFPFVLILLALPEVQRRVRARRVTPLVPIRQSEPQSAAVADRIPM